MKNVRDLSVSIIIPAWLPDADRVRYFMECLESVDQQNRLDYEIICVLDGCTLPEFPRLNMPIRWLFNKERKGPGVARNKAALRARAPYLLPVDADDMLPPDALSALLDQADSTHFVYGDLQYLGERGGLHLLPPYRKAEFLRLTGAAPVTALHSRAAWLQVGGWDESMTALEDVDYYLKLIAAGYSGRHIDQVTLKYRKNPNSRQMTAESGKDVVRTIQEDLRKKYETLYNGNEQMPEQPPCPTCPGKGKVIVGVPMPDENLQNALTVRYEGLMQGTFTVRSHRDPNLLYTVPGKGGEFFIDERDWPQFNEVFTPFGTPQYRRMDALRGPQKPPAPDLPSPTVRVNSSPLPHLPQLDTMNVKQAQGAIDEITTAADLRVLLAEESASRQRTTVINYLEGKLLALEEVE